MRKITNRKAVSPVIATVILVAVAITVSVAVSYWMSGISSQYTQFEKVEIQTGYSIKESGGWKVILDLKNSGSATSSIVSVFVNEVPLNATGYNATDYVPGEIATSIPDTAAGVALSSGETGQVFIWVPTGYGTLSSGTTLDVKLHSANGNDYIKLIKLV